MTTIASVNAGGLRTTTSESGMTEIKAHDSENSMHFGLAKVTVSLRVEESLYESFLNCHVLVKREQELHES